MKCSNSLRDKVSLFKTKILAFQKYTINEPIQQTNGFQPQFEDNKITNDKRSLRIDTKSLLVLIFSSLLNAKGLYR